MDSKIVSKAIRTEIWPVLREHGFTDFSTRTAWRHWAAGVDVVSFQSFNSYLAGGVGSTTYSYSAHLGVLLSYLPHDSRSNTEKPKDYECDIRFTLHKGLAQPLFHPWGKSDAADRADVWYVKPDGSNLHECMADTRHALLNEGLPFLESMRDPATILSLAMQEHNDNVALATSFGAPDSPGFCLIVGFTLLHLGRREEAKVYLQGVLASSAYGDGEDIHAAIIRAMQSD